MLVSLYGNYMLAKGFGRRLFVIEVVKDVAIAVAIVCTVGFGDVALLVGSAFASLVTYCVVVVMTARSLGYPVARMTGDLVPFLLASLAMCGVCHFAGMMPLPSMLRLCVEIISGGAAYVIIMKICGFPELPEGSRLPFRSFPQASLRV